MIEVLRVTLNASEMARKGEEVGQAVKRYRDLEEAKAALTKDYAEQMKACRAEMERLANDLRTGQEDRACEVYEKPRFDDNKVDIIRAETGEVVRVRNLQPSERQTAMDLPYGDDADETPSRTKH